MLTAVWGNSTYPARGGICEGCCCAEPCKPGMRGGGNIPATPLNLDWIWACSSAALFTLLMAASAGVPCMRLL